MTVWSYKQLSAANDLQFLENTVSMLFGPQLISPPLFYLIYYPIHGQFSQNIVKSEHIDQTNPIVPQSQHSLQSTPSKRIIVTKQDLLEEGYDKSKRAWTEEEDQMLLKLCSNPKALFDEIAPFLPGRNAKMCYSRFRRLTNQSKEPWTKSDNQLLRSLVEQYGQKWRDFQKYLPNRNHKQLRDHYQNYLQPSIDCSEWTVEEDLVLIRLINEHGQNWKYIQTLMPNRSRNQLKNRFFGRIRRINSRKLSISDKATTQNEISLAY